MKRSHVWFGAMLLMMYAGSLAALFLIEPPRMSREPLMLLIGSLNAAFGAVVCTPNDDGSITLSDMPVGLFVADVSRQCGSRYAFAAGLTAAELDSAGLYLIADVRPGSDGTASVALTAYDDRIYEAD